MKNYIKELKSIRSSLNTLTSKVDTLIYEYELPIILERVSQYKKRKKGKVTTAWLQKEFQIGYAHAARLLDIVNSK